MKKTLSFVLVAAMLLCMIPAFGIFADEVIEISTAEEFYAITKNMAGNYKLVADITLKDRYVPQDENGNFNEGNPFTGTLDGNGKTITLKLTGQNSERTGIFAQVCGATIKDLNVVADVNFSGTPGEGNSLGAIVGNVVNSNGATTTFTNVKVSGTITTDNTLAAGGFVGAIEGNGTTIFENCKSTVTLTATARGKDAEGGMGGFVGSVRSDNSTVKVINSVANVTITGKNHAGKGVGGNAGGILGFLRKANSVLEVTGGSVSGTISGETYTGAIVSRVNANTCTVTVDGTKINVAGAEVGSAVEGATVTINPYVEPETPDTPDTPDAPETGDFMVVAVLLSVVALAGVAVVSKKRIAC